MNGIIIGCTSIPIYRVVEAAGAAVKAKPETTHEIVIVRFLIIEATPE
jgi:hypothetical protein